MDAGEGLALVSERIGDRLAVRIEGDLDFSSAPRLQDLVEEAAADGVVCCVLDMARVTYIDSEAVKSLMQLRRLLANRGAEMKITRCAEHPLRIIKLLNVTEEIGLVRDAESH